MAAGGKFTFRATFTGSSHKTTKFPDNYAHIKHIFEEREGHLSDTPENRWMLTELANDEHYHTGKDMSQGMWNVYRLYGICHGFGIY